MTHLRVGICWIALISVAAGDDPPATVSGSQFQIPMIEDKFTTEVSAAEARVAKAVADLDIEPRTAKTWKSLWSRLSTGNGTKRNEKRR